MSAFTDMPVVLLDTNVWLDYYLPQRENRDTALRLVDEAHRRSVPLAFASHTCLDIYQRVMYEQKRWVRQSGELTQQMAMAIKRYAWDCVNDVRTIATSIPTGAEDLFLACTFRDRLDDLEDDLVMAACRRGQARYLVTRDAALLQRAPLEAVTPKEMLRLLRSGLVKGELVQKEEPDWFSLWLSQYQDEADQHHR